MPNKEANFDVEQCHILASFFHIELDLLLGKSYPLVLLFHSLKP